MISVWEPQVERQTRENRDEGVECGEGRPPPHWGVCGIFLIIISKW